MDKLILTLRTDKPEAEIGLYQGKNKLAYQTWQAHRSLAETIHTQIDKLINSKSKYLQDLQGIVCYEGPGSFTGLRIGLSVGNALAYANKIPIVTTGSENWIEVGINRLISGGDEKVVLPSYGAAANTTKPSAS